MRFTFYVVFVLAWSHSLLAEDGREIAALPTDVNVSFSRDILPVLQKNCLACHNKSETEGDLVLESVDLISKGGDSGPAIEPGNGDESLLFQVAAHREEPVMPPEDNEVGAKPLSPKQLALLKLWIDQGAKRDDSTAVAEISWRKVPASYAQVFALELSPNGRWLAAGRGNELSVYSVAAGREVQRLVDSSIAETHPDSAHLDLVQSIAWSPDHQTMVSGGFRCIKIWQREAPAAVDYEASDEDRQLLPDAMKEVERFAVSPDKARLVAVTDSDAKLIEVSTGEVVKEIGLDSFAQDELGRLDRAAQLLAEKLRVANADVATAKKRKEDDEKNTKKAEEDLKKAIEAVPKAKERMEKAQEAAKVKERELKETEAKLADAKKALDESTEDAKSEQTVAVGEAQKVFDTKKKELEDLQEAAKKQKQQFEGSQKVVTLAKEAIERAKHAVELRGNELVAAEEEAKAVQERTDDAKKFAEKKRAKIRETQHSLAKVSLLPGDWAFALQRDDGRTATFAWKTGQLLDVYSSLSDSGDGTWRLVKTIGNPKDSTVFADRVTSLAFSHDGKLLATGGGEPSRTGEVLIWDTASWSQVGNVADAHSDVVYDLQFSPQDNTLASCASDRMMKLLDVRAATPIRSFEGHTGHVLGVTWRADGRTLATAGADKVVKVWEAVEGTQKKTISGFKSEVTGVRFLGMADRFVFSMGDGKVESRDSGGNAKPGFPGFTDYVHRVTSSDDGGIVAASGQDRVIRVWDQAGKLLSSWE